jgi:tetratricopeptide (TPR) repeat protein
MKFLPAAVLLFLAGLAGLAMERARTEAGIVPSPSRIPLGGFEPLAVNLLYLRADALIGEQRLPEAITAVRLVTELQPRVPDGWAVLGNCIAWRNSESASDPEAEWKYAAEGLKVFERGLVHNPRSQKLYFALGIFFLMRLESQDDIRSIAERELGGLPSAYALAAFKKAEELRSGDKPTLSGMAESSRLLGYTLLERGHRTEARAALTESLGYFETLAEDSRGDVASTRVGEIRAALEGLEGR